MAEGDLAAAQGWPVVPETGDGGRVRWGAREINRTRDKIAEVFGLIPKSPQAYRDAAGITSGTAAPTGGANGDIYFQILL